MIFTKDLKIEVMNSRYLWEVQLGVGMRWAGDSLLLCLLEGGPSSRSSQLWHF